jgi:8-oxo-dGTP pyrophosphatase MutT (NUDIX family)
VPRAVRLRRLGYRVAHGALHVWWAMRRPHTRGVKVIVRRPGGDVLFVRHTYGRREWELPGGMLRPHEAPEDAARREAREELGVELSWRPLGVAEVGGNAKTTTLHVFLADVRDAGAVRVTPVEISEARWGSPGAPPDPPGRDLAPVLALLDEGGRR